MKNALVFILIVILYFIQTGCDEGLYERDALPDNQVTASTQLTLEEPTDSASEGSVVFWTTPTEKFENLFVTVLKLDTRYEKSGVITSSWLIQGGPGCDECKGCAHFDLPEGMYSYYVEKENGKDVNGRGETFNVLPQGCLNVFVKERIIESEPPDRQTDWRN